MTTSPDARPLVPDEAVERIARLKAAAHYAERFGKDQADPHVQMNVDANWPGFADDVRFTLTAALPHMGGAVAIKPLEWDDGYAFCSVSGGFWRILYHAGKKRWVLSAHNMPHPTDFPDFASEAEAKAAAQADYEARIRSALVASPAPAGWKLMPVAWQWRGRARHPESSEWSDWREGRKPQFRTETYEAEERPLYADPPASPADDRPREVKP